MFRSLLIVVLTTVVPSAALANPRQEVKEGAFLDLVDGAEGFHPISHHRFYYSRNIETNTVSSM